MKPARLSNSLAECQQVLQRFAQKAYDGHAHENPNQLPWMFGKMRLLVGCRSGMTVKFASKFHHGNPFVRGLVICWQCGSF